MFIVYYSFKPNFPSQNSHQNHKLNVPRTHSAAPPAPVLLQTLVLRFSHLLLFLGDRCDSGAVCGGHHGHGGFIKELASILDNNPFMILQLYIYIIIVYYTILYIYIHTITYTMYIIMYFMYV